MKPQMIDEIGLLAETTKPTKSPWFPHLPKAILWKNGFTGTASGADKARLLAKTTAKGVVFGIKASKV